MVLAALTSVSGCTLVQFVELREKPENPIVKRLSLSSFGDHGPSERTLDWLQVTGYEGSENYLPMLQHCRSQLHGGDQREAFHAAAEISYLAAESSRGHDPGLAMELFLDAAEFSWHYATELSTTSTEENLNDLPHRETVEIYNISLEQLLRLSKKRDGYQLGQTLRLPISGRVIPTVLPHESRWLSAEQLGEFEFVSDYELKNLRNRHSKRGLGVPIMVRRERPADQSSLEPYYESGLTLPVTVVARFRGQSLSDAEQNAAVTLELLDARESDGVVVSDTLLPIETDLSTPLAWFLTDPRKSLLETLGLLLPDRAQHLEGIYMIAPYDPDRIPVLMVHGLWSSPMTWMEMFNDLQSDPQLRDKYQFWFYMYPTGEPLTFAAANLRDRLHEVRRICDPLGKNRNLDRMVVVGHSMGGLMSYLLTVNSEDRIWKRLSRLPVNEIHGDSTVHEQIRRVFFFEKDRSVDRIVTIGSPFNGSGYANRFTQWLSGSIISLPNTTSRLSQMIYRQNHQSTWDRMFAPRTSLDSLNKNSAILDLVRHTTVPDNTLHHNIVGVSKGRSISSWTDGVVTLRSASRPDADSELRVKAGHSDVHRHPDAIAEVRRILIDHLEDVQRRKYPVTPVRHEPASESASATLSP